MFWNLFGERGRREKMGEKHIKQKLREAFGLDENLAEIKEYNDETMGDPGFNSLLSDDKVYWIIKSYQADKRRITKFDLNKLNKLNKSIILHGWTFECGIEAEEKSFEFPIVFSNCHANLENNSNTSLFSFQDFKFEKDVIFAGIEFGNVFENTKFEKVTFCRKSWWCKHDDEGNLVGFSFDGIKVHQELVLQDLKFSKGDALNKREGDFSKFKELEKISIINCEFEQEVKFGEIALETLILSGVSFKEQVSFVESEIKELKIDKHGKSTIFSQLCSFKDSNIGDLHFYDGTEFRDLKFENIKESGENIKISFKNVKINGKLEFHNSQEVKVNSLTFESVEFGGGVSFISMQIENFEMKGNENPIKDSVLKSHCHFSKVRIEKANFSNTQFGGSIEFSETEISQMELQNVVFNNEAKFSEVKIGALEFKDGTEFEDLSFLNIFPIADIADSESQTSEGKAKKSKLIELNFRNVKINGNFNFNNSGFQVEDNDQKTINLLSFESVEFGGEVSFRSVKVENFRIRCGETLEELKAGNALPKTITKPSILRGKCRFSEVEITQSADFVGTTFEKDIDFSSLTFPNKSSSEILSDFSYATFKDDTVFGKREGETELYNCSFRGATFEQKAIFWNIEFVRGEKFRDKYEFVGTSFNQAFFNQISFFGEQDGGEEEAIYFDRCKFNSLSLPQSKFEKLELLDSELYDFHLDFGFRVKKNIKADFSGTTFYKEFKVNPDITLMSPKFCSCTFKKAFKFKDFKCEGDVDFSKAVFEDEVIFGVEVRDEKRD